MPDPALILDPDGLWPAGAPVSARVGQEMSIIQLVGSPVNGKDDMPYKYTYIYIYIMDMIMVKWWILVVNNG